MIGKLRKFRAYADYNFELINVPRMLCASAIFFNRAYYILHTAAAATRIYTYTRVHALLFCIVYIARIHAYTRPRIRCGVDIVTQRKTKDLIIKTDSPCWRTSSKLRWRLDAGCAHVYTYTDAPRNDACM